MIDIILKKTAYKNLKSDVQNKRIAHAYLILGGDPGVLREFLRLAAELFAGNDQNIYSLDGNDKITPADIALMVDDMAIMLENGGRKVYVINNADKLSLSAQNKLLKTYEEPPEYVTILLGAPHTLTLLHTIVSRGKKLYIDATENADIEKMLEESGVNSEKARAAAAICGGNIEKAEQFANSNEYVELFHNVMAMLISLKNSSQIAEFLYSPMFSKENVLTTFDFMEIIISDCMKIASGIHPSRVTDPSIYGIAETFSAQGASMSLYVINEAREKLKSNLSSIAAGEHALFGILEAKYKFQ